MDTNLLETYIRTFIVYLVKTQKAELNKILSKYGWQPRSTSDAATIAAVYAAAAASPGFRTDLEVLMSKVALTLPVPQTVNASGSGGFGNTYSGQLISNNIGGILGLGTQLLANSASKKANQAQVEVANLQLQAVKSNNEAQLQLAQMQSQLLAQQAALGAAGTQATPSKSKLVPILLIGGGLTVVGVILWMVFRKKD